MGEPPLPTTPYCLCRVGEGEAGDWQVGVAVDRWLSRWVVASADLQLTPQRNTFKCEEGSCFPSASSCSDADGGGNRSLLLDFMSILGLEKEKAKQMKMETFSGHLRQVCTGFALTMLLALDQTRN